MNIDLELLKNVLSVPTKTYQEEKMVKFLVEWLTENNIPHFVDEHNNVYATKQESSELPEDFYFPCVISHTDTVHNLDTINIREEMLPNAQDEIKLAYKAYNDKGKPTGIGGDDKCGVFACLTILKELPNVKAAFFVSEETGCIGSLKASKDFFTNVGYGIQFDAPENWMITEKCFGQVLFDRESEFFESCDKILKESMSGKGMQYLVHPYTDVYALRSKFDFACINISIGYYDYHSPQEYVVVEDVANGIDIGKKMISDLGNKLHYKKAVEFNWGRRGSFI
jgi:di/tripeptidase